MSLRLRPVRYREARAHIKEHHRHHLPPQGWLFGIGVVDHGQLVGVITVGRPVARALDDGLTAEVTRCCTTGESNACSMLYAAAWRAARAMGYQRLITYTLASEPGSSLRGAGWRVVHQTRGGSWDCPARPREDKAPTSPKTLWEASA